MAFGMSTQKAAVTVIASHVFSKGIQTQPHNYEADISSDLVEMEGSSRRVRIHNRFKDPVIEKQTLAETYGELLDGGDDTRTAICSTKDNRGQIINSKLENHSDLLPKRSFTIFFIPSK